MSSIHRLQNIILKASIRQLSLAHAFSKIQNCSLFNAKSFARKHEQITTLSYLAKTQDSKPRQNKYHQEQSEQSLSMKNKELYLQYVEDVLMKKQQQLVQYEKQLQQIRKHWEQKQYVQAIGKPLTQISEIQLIQRKVQLLRQDCLIPILKMKLYDGQNQKSVKKTNYLQGNKQSKEPRSIKNSQYKEIQQQNEKLKLIYAQFQKKQKQIMQEVNWKRQLSDQVLRQEYKKLGQQKKQYERKMLQFEQLASYQKYLNQMQGVLDEKQYELVQRQKQLQQLNQNYQSPSLQSISNNKSQRKRHNKIFGKKTTQSSPSRLFMKNNQTFAIHQSVQSSIKEESSIKVQEGYSSDDQYPITKNDDIKEESSIKFCNSPYSGNKSRDATTNSKKQRKCGYLNLDGSHQQFFTKNCAIQVTNQNAVQCMERLRKQKLMIKYLSLWTTFSSSQKGTQQHKKVMILNRWKINSNYDQSVPQKLVQIMFALDHNWFKKCDQLQKQKLFPYQQVSLQRKRYLQLFFDHQRRVFHHRRILSSLSAIIRNKNMKQRAAVYIYFHKYNKAAKISSYIDILKLQKTGGPLCQNQNYLNTHTTSPYVNSRVISRSSSKILQQPQIDRVGNGYFQKQKKGNREVRQIIQQSQQHGTQNLQVSRLSNLAKKLRKHNQCSVSNLSPSPGTKKNKQNMSGKESRHNKSISNFSNSASVSRIKGNNKNQYTGVNKTNQIANVDIKKLKEYIKEKQMNERVLAKKYIQAQGVYRMMSGLLIPKVSQYYNTFWNTLKNTDQQQRMADIQKKVNCFQFKWELFITKCRLGLANNSTKIGHLQQLLGFALFDK